MSKIYSWKVLSDVLCDLMKKKMSVTKCRTRIEIVLSFSITENTKKSEIYINKLMFFAPSLTGYSLRQSVHNCTSFNSPLICLFIASYYEVCNVDSLNPSGAKKIRMAVIIWWHVSLSLVLLTFTSHFSSLTRERLFFMALMEALPPASRWRTTFQNDPDEI